MAGSLLTEDGDFDLSWLLQPDKYSTSTSSSLSLGDSTSSNSSMSSGSSFSGLDSGARDQITKAVMPGLTETAGKLSAVPGQYSDAALKLSRNQMRSALETEIPKVMEAMTHRGMGNSSVASDAIGKAYSDIAKDYGDKAYETKMNEAAMQLQLPQIFAALASLAQYSQGANQSSSAGSSKSNTASASESLTENINEPYDRGLDIFKIMLEM